MVPKLALAGEKSLHLKTKSPNIKLTTKD